MNDADRQGPGGTDIGRTAADNALDLDAAGVTSAIVRAGYAYWAALAAERLPSREMIDPVGIPKLLPHVIILGVRRDPLDFVYRLVGGEVARHLAPNRTGQWLSSIPSQRQPSQIWSNLAAIAQFGRPLANKTPYAGPSRSFLNLQEVQLPLAADGRTVDAILVFADFVPKK